MLNKIVSIKNTNAIFLAIVLVAGVITIASPFSAFAQAYHGYEKEYNSYDQYKPEMRYGKSEPIPEYNDYYEPMKQQQSSYDNNNDGYDYYEPMKQQQSSYDNNNDGYDYYEPMKQQQSSYDNNNDGYDYY